MSTKELQARLDALESKQRGTSKALKNVQDIQAGIGVSALIYQKVKTYIFAAILGIFGLGYIIYASTTDKNKHNKETDYVVGAVCLGFAVLLVVIFNVYSGAVKKNKNLQIYNAFLVESQMLAGRK